MKRIAGGRWVAGVLGTSLSVAMAGCVVKTSTGDEDGSGGTASGDTGGASSGNTGGGAALGGTASGGAPSASGGSSGGVAAAGGTTGNAGGAGGNAGGAGGNAGGAGGALPIAWLECGSRDVTGATVIEAGDLSGEQSWSGTVFVRGAVRVRAKVTIAPGTRVIFDAKSGLDFAWNSGEATLIAAGTAAEPIRFCGAKAEAGYWSSLAIETRITPESVLRNVLIADGGGGAAALRVSGPILIDSLQVRNSGGVGVEASTFAQQGRGLSVQGSAGSALVFTAPLAITRFPIGGVFEGNAENLARIDLNELTGVVQFHDLGIPYLQETNVNVAASELHFDAGVEYRFNPDTTLEVAWNTRETTFTAAGTEQRPVVLRGAEPRPGYWSGLQVRGSATVASHLSHVRILHAGALEVPALAIEAPITLSDVTLEDNAVGASIDASGLGIDSANLNITRTAGVPLVVEPNALVTLPTGGSFTGNDEDFISVVDGDYTARGTVPLLDVPYRVEGSISTLEDSVLKLLPGTTFVMAAGSELQVAWNTRRATIDAVGTAALPIVFRGASEQAGSWNGINIGTNVVVADSRLEFVEVGHGGLRTSERANLVLNGAIPVRNCRFFSSTGYGVLKRAADTTDYAQSNTFEGTPLGAVGDL